MAQTSSFYPTAKLFKIQTVWQSKNHDHWSNHFGYFITNHRGFCVYYPRKEFDYEHSMDLQEVWLPKRWSF